VITTELTVPLKLFDPISVDETAIGLFVLIESETPPKKSVTS
jgi:hypothetical protein